MSHATAGADRQTLPTSPLAAPWALTRPGRPKDGKTPPARLTFLTEAVTHGGRVRAWRGIPLERGAIPPHAHPRRFEPVDILFTFRVRPSPTAIRRALRQSRPTPGGQGRGDRS